MRDGGKAGLQNPGKQQQGENASLSFPDSHLKQALESVSYQMTESSSAWQLGK